MYQHSILYAMHHKTVVHHIRLIFNQRQKKKAILLGRSLQHVGRKLNVFVSLNFSTRNSDQLADMAATVEL